MKIPISEEFSSIQGEGMCTGVHSYFVRTGGCNLRCFWCDTPYTSWKPEMKQTEVSEIFQRIVADPARHVVITGGEPMLFPEPVAALIKLCNDIGKPVTIETNGTIYDSRVQPNLWSVSPKLPSSAPTADNGQGGSETLNLNARELHLKNIECADLRMFFKPTQESTACQFKFVVTTPRDVEDVETLCVKHRVPKHLIWLMPEGRTAVEVLEKQKWVADLCKERGYNLSTRLHTLIWGARRGV